MSRPGPRYEQPLRSLSEHPIGAVRRWAQVTLTQMRKQIDSAKMEDDEQEAQWAHRRFDALRRRAGRGYGHIAHSLLPVSPRAALCWGE
jgi:hypothetical protein